MQPNPLALLLHREGFRFLSGLIPPIPDGTLELVPGSPAAREPDAAEGLLDRGIYRSRRWRIDGFPVLFAIDSKGNRLRRVVVLRPEVDELAAFDWLERQLDANDPPRPALRLIG